ncbi:hypothetical protein LY76DRAFT_238804 [Colletotrichum caudatum]|nr:hypothetical protein LY76DRAFT_238804 [Colletotrichum caudatum]
MIPPCLRAYGPRTSFFPAAHISVLFTRRKAQSFAARLPPRLGTWHQRWTRLECIIEADIVHYIRPFEPSFSLEGGGKADSRTHARPAVLFSVTCNLQAASRGDIYYGRSLPGRRFHLGRCSTTPVLQGLLKRSKMGETPDTEAIERVALAQPHKSA